MLSSITPLGERGRGNRWGATVGWFVTGSTLGGTAVGVLLGGIGLAVAALVPIRGRLVVVLALAAFAAVVDAARRPGLLPSWRRQVDERWMDGFRPWVYGFGWGAQLGTGVLTIVSSAATYLLLALAVLVGSPAAAVALAATFGAVRGLTLLAAHGLSSPAALHSFHQRMAARRRLAVLCVIVADAGVAIMAAMALST